MASPLERIARGLIWLWVVAALLFWAALLFVLVMADFRIMDWFSFITAALMPVFVAVVGALVFWVISGFFD